MKLTGLIYNVSNTKAHQPESGVSEVLRDKFLDPDLSNPDKPVSGVIRQVAHLLYHSQTPFTIVAHSHGALITRNALRIAYQMGRGPWIQQNVRIVFCGAPLSSETVPSVNQIAFKTNPGDLVAQWIGARGGAGSAVAFPAG